MRYLYFCRPFVACFDQLWIRTFSFLFLLLFLFPYNSFSQYDPAPGDFRSVGTGGWRDYSTWEVFNGTSWDAAIQDQIPGKESSVYLQEMTHVFLDSTSACKDLHIHQNSFLSLDTAALDVWGYLRFFENTLPGNNLILPSANSGEWISSAKEGALRFKGETDRTLISPGSGGISNGLTGFNIEIAFEEGYRAIVEEDFRVDSLTVVSGVFDVIANTLYVGNTLNVGGHVVIMNEAAFNPPAVSIVKSVTQPFEGFYLDSLATIILSTDDLILAANMVELKGSVVTDETLLNPIHLPTPGSISGAAAINTFNHLYLKGSNEKILSGDITVNGILSLEHPDDLTDNGHNISYGSNGSLEYAGTTALLTSNREFPATNGPANLIISNPSVSLHDHRVLPGQLILNGGNLYLGDYDLTFGADSPAIVGEFSATNMVVISEAGAGQLKKVFNSPGVFFFPIGENHEDTEYTPAQITVNPEGFNPATLGLRVIDEKYAEDISDFGYLSRFWELNGDASLKINAKFFYHEDDATAQEYSTNAYHYVGDTAIVHGSANTAEKSVTFHNAEIELTNYFTGSNWGKVDNNIIFGFNDHCGPVDHSETTSTIPTVDNMEVSVEYLWEMRIDEGDWQEIPSAIGQNYDPNELTSPGFYQFRRRVLPDGDSIYHNSNVLSFNVYPAIVNTIGTPSTTEFCLVGTGFSINGATSTGGDGNLNFQWERSSDNGLTFETVGMDSIHYLEEDLLTSGLYLYRRAILSVCNIHYSDTVEVAVYDDISSNVVTFDESQYCGIPDEIKVLGTLPSGGDGNYVYEWERRIPGASSFEAVGGNTQNLIDEDIQALGEYLYKRTVYAGICGSINSNTISIHVRPELSENTISIEEDIIYCGTNSAFSIEGSAMTGGNGTYSYVWERSKDGGTFTNLLKNEVNYTQLAGLEPGEYAYRRTVKSVCETTSEVVEVTILAPITNNTIIEPTNLEYCGLPEEIALQGSDPEGGNGAYTYSWERRIGETSFEPLGSDKDFTDNDITEVGRYQYRRMVSSGSCEGVPSDTLTIDIYPVLSENTLTSEATSYCTSPEGVVIDGSTMSGGNGTYTYVWEKKINDEAFIEVGSSEDFEETSALLPGNYQYRRTVTSSVCTSTSEIFNIEVQYPLANNVLVALSEDETVFCGSTAGFTIEGSVPTGGSGTYIYTYERQHEDGNWETVGTDKDFTEGFVDVPGHYNYRRIVTTDICQEHISDTVSVYISSPITIVATITETTDNLSTGSIMLEVSGGTPPYSYFWTNLADTKDITNLDGNDYSVKITDANNCFTEETYTVPRITGIRNNPKVSSYKLFPNPVKNTLHIEALFTKHAIVELTIINNVGKLVKTTAPFSADQLNLQFDMSSHPNGIYFIKLRVDNDVETWKFIKE